MTVREAERALTKKLGASRDPSGDHIYYYLQDSDSEYTVGKISHSWGGQMNDAQVNMLAKKLRLFKREFEDFVDCAMDTGRMLEVWRQRR